MNLDPTNHAGAGQPAAQEIQMCHQTDPCPIDATPDAEAFDDIGIEPWAYLKEVLRLAEGADPAQLTPRLWQAARTSG